jgi:epoxyqueuosine reductase
MESLLSQIKNAARSMGYEKCGIIKIADMSGYEEKLNERITCFPETQPQLKNFYRFARLEDVYPWAKSIVVCARYYGKYYIPEHLEGMIAKYYLVDSRIDKHASEHQDSLRFEAYMQELGLRTETERKFGVTALRWAAVKAGLGTIRKNNFFYTESGSWVHLEAWLIDKELESVATTTLKECPANCNQCIKACPTASLAQPYAMNFSSCISCLTTFAGRDLPTEKFNEQMGSWVYGCDVCQDVCPMNKKRWQAAEEFPLLNELGEQISLEKILTMDYEFLEQVIQSKFFYIQKQDVWKWKANAINAMVNDYKEQYLECIYDASNDRHEKVREMARWAISKLNLSPCEIGD